MRILHVISSFPPAYTYGGPANIAYSMCKELVRLGHEVTVYTTDAYDKNRRIPSDLDLSNVEGVIVKRFGNISNTAASKYNIPFSLTLLREFGNKISNYDVVHLHEYRSLHAYFVYRYCIKKEIPFVLQAHGSLPVILEKTQLKKIYDNLLGRNIIRYARKGIALTKEEVISYRDAGMDFNKIELIPNGIALPTNEDRALRSIFKKKMGLSEGMKVILYLGRLHRIKGLDILIKSFYLLNREVPETVLVIAGPDDGMKDALVALVRELNLIDKVLFVGSLHTDAKKEAFLDSTLFILPSMYDAYPTTVMESCSYGVPVIVSNKVGLADTVSGIAGYSVKPFPETIAEAAIKILCDAELWQRFHDGAIALSKEKFNIRCQVRIIEEMYKNIV